jgi:lipopolysaccharide/colanic/teichoic acid biosynthesis glycosyltransferase
LAQYDWLNRISVEEHLLRGRSYTVAKRLMDLLLVILAIPVLVPAFIICIVLIKFEDSSGPIFFVQQRTGKGGRRFSMYKFRTMVPNAEELKNQLAAINEDGELAGPLKLENDPRITRIGHLLRKTSLDELPQVINIIRGEMSWVGPRPTSFGTKSYLLWHTERLDVIPGITGLWQLYGRGDTDFDVWLYWDTLYIENKSIWLDIQIILRTAFAIFNQRGAR